MALGYDDTGTWWHWETAVLGYTDVGTRWRTASRRVNEVEDLLDMLPCQDPSPASAAKLQVTDDTGHGPCPVPWLLCIKSQFYSNLGPVGRRSGRKHGAFQGTQCFISYGISIAIIISLTISILIIKLIPQSDSDIAIAPVTLQPRLRAACASCR